MGVEPKLFCGSEPSSCWVAVGPEEDERQNWWLSKTYTSVTDDHPRTRLDHSPDLVRLTPPRFPSTAPTFPTSQFLSLSPCWEHSVSHSLSVLQLCLRYTDPLVKVKPQRPVKEEEPKTAGDLDQEAVRAWGLEGGWPESPRKVDRERSLNPRIPQRVRLLRPSCLPPHLSEPALRRPGSSGPQKAPAVVPSGPD